MAKGFFCRCLLLDYDGRLQGGQSIPEGPYPKEVQPLVVLQVQVLDFSFQCFLPWSIFRLFAAPELGGACSQYRFESFVPLEPVVGSGKPGRARAGGLDWGSVLGRGCVPS